MQGAGISITGSDAWGARFTNAGTLINDSGSSTNTIWMELANTGTIHLMSGVLRLNSPSFIQPDGATLQVTIDGTRPGIDFGQLQVSGAATLGGNLLLTNPTGFIPIRGQTFQVLTCGWGCKDGGAAVSVNYRAQYNAQDVTLIPLVSVTLDPTGPM
jgi:hypothetical protein